MDATLDEYEPIDGRPPYRSISRHPNGVLVAGQVGYSNSVRAGIWNSQTRKLVWCPPDAIALCWTLDGDQLLQLREVDPRNFRRPVYQRIQPRPSYILERWSWLQQEIIDVSLIVPPSGWLLGVAVSPRSDLAAFHWVEQDSSGFGLTVLGGRGDYQLTGHAYRTMTNTISDPVFSPKGDFIVVSCDRPSWRKEQTADISRAIGHVAIYNMVTGAIREHIVHEDVSVDLKYDLKHPRMLGVPLFTTDTSFTVTLLTGAVRTFETGSAFSSIE
jgi:hypothetical protein